MSAVSRFVFRAVLVGKAPRWQLLIRSTNEAFGLRLEREGVENWLVSPPGAAPALRIPVRILDGSSKVTADLMAVGHLGIYDCLRLFDDHRRQAGVRLGAGINLPAGLCELTGETAYKQGSAERAIFSPDAKYF